MARPLRIEYPGAIYHVMNRGTNRCPIFLNSTGDRSLFKGTLADSVDLWKIKIHAFSLMDNHYHLLIETPLGNLSRAMRHIDGVYTQRFNRIHERDGALFRGRYKSILVQDDVYFLQLVRYIHLNGVKALIYTDPNSDGNCSHPAYRGAKPGLPWLCREKTLSFFKEHHDPSAALDRFVREGIPQEIQDTLSKKRWPAILGDKNFIAEIKRRFPPKKNPHSEIPEQNKLFREKNISVLRIIEAIKRAYGLGGINALVKEKKNKEGRWALCFLLRNHAHMKQKDIGALMGGLSYSGVARVLERHDFSSSLIFKNIQREILGDELLSNGKI